jgi:ketosteroid isomerase-like protein
LKFRTLRLIGLLLGFLPAARPAVAQASPAAPTDSLYRTIAALDSAMFDAYNRCDLERLATFLADDLEFYHDQTGLSRGRQAVIDAVRQNICGKVHRDPVPGTLEVYPLRGYGAVATGIHRFCDARTHQRCDGAGGPAKFVTLWQYSDGGWKIARVISYDHH